MPRAAQYFPGKDEFKEDKGITLNIYQCSRCGLVQISMQPVEYFKEVITATSFSDKTKSFRLSQMNDFSKKFCLAGKRVLEIGCCKGNMLDIMKEAGLNAVGLEASSESVSAGKAAGRNMLCGYIGDMNKIPGHPYDAFVCLNYLEHLPDPDRIIKIIHDNTAPDATGYVTVPNLDFLLESKCLYEFVADHLSYFTKKTLAFAFEKNGFDVIDCHTINEDNDIVAIVKKKQPLDLSMHFTEVEALIKDLKQIIEGYKSDNMKVAAWGAGHRALALLSLAGISDIEYVIDSAKFKQGRFTPSLHLNIVAPEYLRQNKVDLVIVMVPGIYPDEVIRTLLEMNLGVDIAVLRGNEIEFIRNDKRR
ncbi:MAG: class I SAM-dependent methyltransferase [Victivallales bacterium]